MHKRAYFFDKELCVASSAATTQTGHMRRRVFLQAVLSGIVDSNNNQRFDEARLNAVIGGVTDVPILPRNEGRGAIKKILSVMEIENGVLPVRLRVIAGREINNQIALITEKARGK